MYVLHDKDPCVISLVIGPSTSIVYIIFHDLCKDAYMYIYRSFFFYPISNLNNINVYKYLFLVCI